METLKDYDEVLQEETPDEMSWDTQAGSAWQEGEEDGMRVYVCNSCGGQVITDATTAATQCPYCGNPMVMASQFAGDLRPDYVIPFRLDLKAAKEAMKRHLQKKRLLPKAFKTQNHIDEIKGVYVPFWLSTPARTPISTTAPPACASGATASTITPKPATLRCTAPAVWASSAYPWTARPKCPTI